MDGEVRRQKILIEIQGSESPVSGTQLARNFEVSRQVIVQDIAVLRAAGNEIVSTCRGYICQGSHRASRVIRVKHTDDEIMEELNTIVGFHPLCELPLTFFTQIIGQMGIHQFLFLERAEGYGNRF